MMDETDELPGPGFTQDWNFIVLSHGSMIYDINTGILYDFHAQIDHRDSDRVYARKVGHLEADPFKALIDGPAARDFWRQLQERVRL